MPGNCLSVHAVLSLSVIHVADALWQPRFMTLDPIQQRVLGALIEKEITTPENYPLSLNSLLAACNQRSSRDPVLDLSEDEVRQAVHSLEDMEIVSPVRDARVPKYEHRIRTVLNLRRDETAVICLLLLRGPQTPGELRGRADRMYSFDDLSAVQSTLERLANRGANASEDAGSNAGGSPLVVMLPRLPGSRESRYAQLLGGPVAVEESARTVATHTAQSGGRAANITAEDLAQITADIEAKIEARFAARMEAIELSVAAIEGRVRALEAMKPDSFESLEPPVGQL
jgi:uncharacterized protein